MSISARDSDGQSPAKLLRERDPARYSRASHHLLMHARRCALALAIVAGTLAASFGTASAGEPPAREVLQLEPGDNFVGWVAEPISVADIFEAIPAASLIYHWDADSRRWQHAIRGIGGNLETLQPGMAARIRIDGDESVKWDRRLAPAKGSVTLYKGLNWVTWLGRDDWPLEQLARGIGTSLVSIRVGDRTWPASIDDTVDDLPTLRRGDAVEVTVSRDLRWLQPTGTMPTVVWVGDISQSLQDNMTEGIREVVDYFAETHGVETDFSDTTILIWRTVDDAVAYQDGNPKFPFHLSGDGLRLHLEQVAGAGATAWGVFVPAYLWHSNPRHSNFKTFLAHELFHYLQLQYTDSWQAAGRPPEWLLEGTAVWSGELGIRVAEGQQTLDQSRREYLDNAKETAATLRSAEQRNFPWQYQLGLLAVDLLVERSGTDSIVEYFRQQRPQVVGPDRLWRKSPSLDEAFVAAFGLRHEDFYPLFEQWRDQLPGRQVRDSAEPRLRGNLRNTDGQPATGFWVNAAPWRGGHEAGRWRRTRVGEDGTFSLSLLPDTVQRVYFERDGCYLWLTDSGLSTTRPESGEYRDVDTSELPTLDLQLPAGACSQENRLRVEVFSLRGDERRVSVVLNSEDEQLWFPASRAQSGAYSAFAPEPGRYRVRVLLGGCDLWYRDGGLVASRGDGDLVVLSRQPVSLEIRIPVDRCVRTISGRLIAVDRPPVDNPLLYANRGDVYGRAVWGEDGEFAITVPESGEFRLYVWDGCPVYLGNAGATVDWRQAIPITVNDADITGIEFVAPADPASLCHER